MSRGHVSASLLEDADVETSTARYAARFAGTVGEYFLEVQTAYAQELLAPWPGGRVLDVGGGHAQSAIPLVAAGYDVTVAGSQPSCAERLDQALTRDRYAFALCDGLVLPFPDRHFDLVLSFRLLPHVTNWTRLVDEMCRVARHAVVVDFPATQSLNVVADRLFGLKKAVEQDTRPYRCFSREELVEAFATHQFAVDAFRPQFAAPMFLHRKLGRGRLSRTIERTAGRLGVTARFGSPVILRALRHNSR